MSRPNAPERTPGDGTPASPAEADARHARLVRLLDMQLAAAEKLDALSREQSARLDAGEAEAALLSIVAREELVTELARRAEELNPLVEAVLNNVRAVAQGRRVEVAARAQRLSELVAAVAARDQKDQHALACIRDRLETELSDLTRGRGAVGAYDVPGPVDATMQDRRG
jgi:hypothetical protein